jgi:membrane associated rhomboid family serine protease
VTNRAVVTTLGIFAVVFCLQLLLGLVGVGQGLFALALPLSSRPWTLVVSVYAHSSVPHLLANAVALVVVGTLLAYRTSALRFHAFFLAAGVLTGLTEVFVGAALGQRVAVLGASGAVFALAGYLLAGNRITDAALGGVTLRPRTQLLVGVVLAAALTWLTASPGVALAAHFSGVVVGLLAGRFHVLDTRGT